MIYDLLEKGSAPLELREDVDGRAHVMGLRRIKVESAMAIMGLLREGNSRRKTESTDANSQSSRSHAVRRPSRTRPPTRLCYCCTQDSDKGHYRSALRRRRQVLEIVVKRTERNRLNPSSKVGKLSLVDLAGSERAHDTNNTGQARLPLSPLTSVLRSHLPGHAGATNRQPAAKGIYGLGFRVLAAG